MRSPRTPLTALFTRVLVASARHACRIAAYGVCSDKQRIPTYNPERQDPPISRTGVSSGADRGLPGCQTPEMDHEASARREGRATRRVAPVSPKCSAVRPKLATRRQVVAPACSGSAAETQTTYSVGYAERHALAGRAAKKGVSRDGAHTARVTAGWRSGHLAALITRKSLVRIQPLLFRSYPTARARAVAGSPSTRTGEAGTPGRSKSRRGDVQAPRLRSSYRRMASPRPTLEVTHGR